MLHAVPVLSFFSLAVR